jgi:Flp pilus assembly protein TadG
MKRLLQQKEKGTTIVEFAVVAMLFFATIFAIIEFGVLVYDQHVLTNASREGARAGIIMRVPRLSDNEIQTVVNSYAAQHMVSFKPSAVLTTAVTPTIRDTFGTELAVNVTYPFEFMFLSGLGIGPIQLKAETRMRME